MKTGNENRVQKKLNRNDLTSGRASKYHINSSGHNTKVLSNERKGIGNLQRIIIVSYLVKFLYSSDQIRVAGGILKVDIV